MSEVAAVGRAYNGWSAHVRNARWYQLEAFLPHTGKGSFCRLCGDAHGAPVEYKDAETGLIVEKPMSMALHGEEYGSTPEAYLKFLWVLCPRCHGMIHIRFRFRNLWNRYVHKVRTANFGGCRRFRTMTEFFAHIKTELPHDIPSYPWADTGIDFIDGIPKGGWKGKPKIATVKLTYGGEIPDPAIYEAGWETMTGCVVREDGSTIEEVTFKE